MVKFLHLAGTAWFISCLGCIFVLTLRQAGVRWWVIFSLSGYSTPIVFVLISVYLYAIFRGVTSSQTVTVEHPLTTTSYYLIFYVITPLLAGATSGLAMIDESNFALFASGVAIGTIGTTFMVWVIIDPLIASLELLLPQSRKSRTARKALIRAEKEKKQKAREVMLKRVIEREQESIRRWREDLKEDAENLSELLATGESNVSKAEAAAIEMGVHAWQKGGLDCMKQLRRMAIEIYKQKNKNYDIVDYISVWWDGIGNWRNTSLC